MLITLDEHLERCAREGDLDAAAELFETHRERLLRTVTVRMNPRLRGWVDAQEVVEVVLRKAVEQAPAFLNGDLFSEEQPSTFLWLWTLTIKELNEVEGHRLRNLRIGGGDTVPASSGCTREDAAGMLAAALVGSVMPQPQAPQPDESCNRVREAVRTLRREDQEILICLHLEHLSGLEVARIQGIPEASVARHNMKALQRLRTRLSLNEDWDGAEA